MNIKQNFITSKSRPRQPLNPIGIVLHDTDTPGATAQNEHDYFQNSAPPASAHAFVDCSGIIQLIPWNEKAWHVGAKGNSKFIGIELCVPKVHDINAFNTIWQNGVELFAYLYKNVLKKPCDSDTFWWHERVSRELGGTDHVDPVPFFKEYGKTVQDFKNDVIKVLGQASTVKTINTVREVQAALIALQYDPGIADGIMGPKTMAAIKKFQKDNKLIVDGIAGTKTKAKLAELLNR